MNVLVVYDINSKLSSGKVIHLEQTSAFDDFKSKKVFIKNANEYVVFGCDNSFNIVNVESSKA
jgi:hypothetical protein